ncbi:MULTISPECIES: immunoglobulin-like domain-containing protein, partial [unclassified Pseudomonas]|uniref:immunoglobulin-like domain-containing protein n=1 Tax=unclassified Pseudomonas TaxID=196821 RepID=UPI001F566CB6
TLSNGQTITIKAGESAGSTVFHTPANDVYNNSSTVSTTIAKTVGGNFENLVTDPKAAVTTITDSIDNTTVSLTADKASVVEGGDITYTATLTNKAQTDVTVTLSNGQTITIKAGDSAGSTVFHTPANDVYNNGSTVSTTIAKTAGGNFENLVTDPKAAVTTIT